MNKKIVLSLLFITLIGAFGALIYNLKSDNSAKKSSINLDNEKSKIDKPIKESSTTKENAKETSNEQESKNDEKSTTNSKENSSDIKESNANKNETQEVKPTNSKPPSNTEILNSFKDGLTRENLNGYYKITRSDGGIGYGKLTNDGLFTLDQRPSGVVLTNVYRFTTKPSNDKNKFEFQLNGEMSNSSFTVKSDDELYVNLPNFGDVKNYVYKRISQNEYESGAQKLVVRENKFPTIGDYYFSNRGQVGTMSSVESTININNKDYKVVKSHNSDQKVIISLFGQTYNYNTYKTTGSLIEDSSDMYCGFN